MFSLLVFFPILNGSHPISTPPPASPGESAEAFFSHISLTSSPIAFNHICPFLPSSLALVIMAFSGSHAPISLQLFQLMSIVICCIIITIAVSSCFDLFHLHRAIIHAPSVHCSSTEWPSSTRPIPPFHDGFPSQLITCPLPPLFFGFYFLQFISAP